MIAAMNLPAASRGESLNVKIINLKAEVIGLPPGQAALIAVENDWWRNVCTRDQKTGLYFVNVTLTGNELSRIRILGTGKANPPIEYPFLRQVALQ